ncbi:hypothetical protein LXL04_028814 [Taraxacum kok-saghyz]
MLDIEHHRNIVPFIGRKLRIEHLGEQILDEGYMQEEIGTYYISFFKGIRMGRSWTVDTFLRQKCHYFLDKNVMKIEDLKELGNSLVLSQQEAEGERQGKLREIERETLTESVDFRQHALISGSRASSKKAAASISRSRCRQEATRGSFKKEAAIKNSDELIS